MRKHIGFLTFPCSVALIATAPSLTYATIISLGNAAATFSQTCDGNPHSPNSSVDSITTGNNGWAVARSCGSGDTSGSETAVWETNSPFSATNLDFRFIQNLSGPGENILDEHLIGRFRLSVTSDDPNTFADGVETGGDVTANWTVLINPNVSGPAGLTFTTQPDDSVLVGGTVPDTATYTVLFTGSFFDITGVRLEVLEDASLPFNGPGLKDFNGNFTLTELTLDASGVPTRGDAVPEPGIMALFAVGLAGLGFLRRRKTPHVLTSRSG